MKDHIRFNPKDMQIVCGNCGVMEDLVSGLTVALEETLVKFRAAHGACLRPVFKAGDRVSFCGETATVIANHGDSGTVELPGKLRERCVWRWEFEGEPVIPVRA